MSGHKIAYANALELSQELAASPEVHNCYASQLLEFMLGRDLQPSDLGTVGLMAYESLNDKLSIKELMLSVITSNTFRARRAQP